MAWRKNFKRNRNISNSQLTTTNTSTTGSTTPNNTVVKSNKIDVDPTSTSNNEYDTVGPLQSEILKGGGYRHRRGSSSRGSKFLEDQHSNHQTTTVIKLRMGFGRNHTNKQRETISSSKMRLSSPLQPNNVSSNINKGKKKKRFLFLGRKRSNEPSPTSSSSLSSSSSHNITNNTASSSSSSAIVIQAAFRGYLIRSEPERLYRKVTKIQSHIRRHIAQNKAKLLALKLRYKQQKKLRKQEIKDVNEWKRQMMDSYSKMQQVECEIELNSSTEVWSSKWNDAGAIRRDNTRLRTENKKLKIECDNLLENNSKMENKNTGANVQQMKEVQDNILSLSENQRKHKLQIQIIQDEIDDTKDELRQTKIRLINELKEKDSYKEKVNSILKLVEERLIDREDQPLLHELLEMRL